MKLRQFAPVVALAATALTLTACSGTGPKDGAAEGSKVVSGTPVRPAEPGTPPVGAEPQAPAEANAGAGAKKKQVLTVAKIDGFSPLVTNQKGRTIYRFDNDSNSPATSTCFGPCAKTWEPVLAGSGVEIADAAIKQGLVGVLERPEGRQVTLNNWPLYYYKDDLKLGQTAGQGKGGTWFAIAPNGKKATQLGGGSASTAGASY